ncbi:MAG: hypothetical protein JNN30_10330 [Rhodanobacteraceae bacterium]|nr:hypothetical protein [Rhodanobacteraceae bacterium]
MQLSKEKPPLLAPWPALALSIASAQPRPHPVFDLKWSIGPLQATLGVTTTVREGDAESRFTGNGLPTIEHDLSMTRDDFAHRAVVDLSKVVVRIGYLDSGAVGTAAFKADGTPDTTFGVNGETARGAPLQTIASA